MTEFEKLTLRVLCAQMDMLGDIRRQQVGAINEIGVERLGDLRREVSDAMELTHHSGLPIDVELNRMLVSQPHHSGGHLVGLVFETEAAGLATMHAVIDLVRAYMLKPSPQSPPWNCTVADGNDFR